MTYEQEAALKELKEQAYRARRLADELERYAQDLFEPSAGIPVQPSERFCWAINDIENYIRNINFATLCRIASNLK